MRRALICLIGPQTLFFLFTRGRGFVSSSIILLHFIYIIICCVYLPPDWYTSHKKTQCAENTKDSQEENEWSARLTDCRREWVVDILDLASVFTSFTFELSWSATQIAFSWIIIYIFLSLPLIQLLRSLTMTIRWQAKKIHTEELLYNNNHFCTYLIRKVQLWPVWDSHSIHSSPSHGKFQWTFSRFHFKVFLFPPTFLNSQLLFFPLLFSTCALFSASKDFSLLTRRTKTRFFSDENFYDREPDCTTMENFSTIFCWVCKQLHGKGHTKI